MPSSTISTPYGFRATLTAPLTPAEATTLLADIKRVLGARKKFCQLWDLRAQKPSSEETNAINRKTMQWLVENGVERSAVVLSNSTTKMQISRLARETGVYAYERYFDASREPHWEAKAKSWIEQGTDPDA